MATLNKIVTDQQWNAEAIRDYKHFKGIVIHQGIEAAESEIEEAYKLITGKEPGKKESKTAK